MNGFFGKKVPLFSEAFQGKSGRLVLTLSAPVGFDLVNWVLAWPEAEVAGPDELRKELKNVGSELVKKYGKL